MVFLYYISTHPLKINRVFSIRAFFNFIKNLILLNLLSFKVKNSSNAKISVLLVYIPIRLNTSFLIIIRK
jgi:hypothetical protein